MKLITFLKIIGIFTGIISAFAILFNINKIRKCKKNGGGLVHYFTGARVGRPCTMNNMCSTFKCVNKTCIE